jgi:hypothetical protein
MASVIIIITLPNPKPSVEENYVATIIIRAICPRYNGSHMYQEYFKAILATRMIMKNIETKAIQAIKTVLLPVKNLKREIISTNYPFCI